MNLVRTLFSALKEEWDTVLGSLTGVQDRGPPIFSFLQTSPCLPEASWSAPQRPAVSASRPSGPLRARSVLLARGEGVAIGGLWRSCYQQACSGQSRLTARLCLAMRDGHRGCLYNKDACSSALPQIRLLKTVSSSHCVTSTLVHRIAF